MCHMKDRIYLKNIVDKFERGDPINDAELKELYEFFVNLEASLDIMGNSYWLAWTQIVYNKTKTESYLNARKFS